MTSIPFAFQINGKNIDPTSLDDKRASETLNQIVESVIDRTGELICQTHGEPPRFVFVGPDIDNLTMEVSGCCEELINEVKLRLNS